MVDATVRIIPQKVSNWTILSHRMQELKAHIWHLNEDNMGVLERRMIHRVTDLGAEHAAVMLGSGGEVRDSEANVLQPLHSERNVLGWASDSPPATPTPAASSHMRIHRLGGTNRNWTRNLGDNLACCR